MEEKADLNSPDAGRSPVSMPASSDGMRGGVVQLRKVATSNGIEGRLATHLPSPLPTPTEQTPNHSPSPDSQSFPANGQTDTQGSDTQTSIAQNSETPSHGLEALQSSSRDGSENRVPSRSGTRANANEGVRRLSASEMRELAAAPGSLPIASIAGVAPSEYPLSAGFAETSLRHPTPPNGRDQIDALRSDGTNTRTTHLGRTSIPPRTLSTPPTGRRKSNSQPLSDPFARRRNSSNPALHSRPPDLEGRSNPAPTAPKMASGSKANNTSDPPLPSPIPPTIPLPPMSIPTVLQLELAAQRPSPLYIHHSYASDLPFESNAVKFERLTNFLLLPSYFERTMNFGALACLDAWLWTFTILPMRFVGAIGVLVRWWGYLLQKEVQWLVGFVWYGLGRLWTRRRRGRPTARADDPQSARSSGTEDSRSRSRSHGAFANGAGSPITTSTGHDARIPRGMDNARPNSNANGGTNGFQKQPNKSNHSAFRHRRTKSMPSSLTSVHKADLLQGAVIICSSIFLMNLDASRMYHFIRAQSAMKLYVIYNVLEVSDRLLAALGQDIFECLFSSETLSRNSFGRSKLLLPFGMFLLALAYNTFHSVTLFYQVTTLNVAVNSYSNALLTLLISNQFVEIKSSVFKRFEKENTFQLTCADIVERFQMWVMLLIIGMRNVVEVGGLSIPGAGTESGGDDPTSRVPLHSASILPASFTLVPSWLLSGEVLSPFLIVIGSEMIVDWIKHAYINKFNNIKPTLYSRILDILCKDYYTSVSFPVR